MLTMMFSKKNKGPLGSSFIAQRGRERGGGGEEREREREHINKKFLAEWC